MPSELNTARQFRRTVGLVEYWSLVVHLLIFLGRCTARLLRPSPAGGRNREHGFREAVGLKPYHLDMRQCDTKSRLVWMHLSQSIVA